MPIYQYTVPGFCTYYHCYYYFYLLLLPLPTTLTVIITYYLLLLLSLTTFTITIMLLIIDRMILFLKISPEMSKVPYIYLSIHIKLHTMIKKLLIFHIFYSLTDCAQRSVNERNSVKIAGHDIKIDYCNSKIRKLLEQNSFTEELEISVTSKQKTQNSMKMSQIMFKPWNCDIQVQFNPI